MLSCVPVGHFSTTAKSVRRSAEPRRTSQNVTRLQQVPLGSRHLREQTVAQQKTASKISGKRRSSNKSMKKSAASRRAKSTDASGDDASPSRSVGDQEVTIDRRRQNRRDEGGPLDAGAGASQAGSPKLERRVKVNRRRQIDPTTCERDYTEHEVEFMNALDEYKRKSGRMFPTCSEVLEVVRSLGYAKVGADPAISCSAEPFVGTAESPTIAAPESESIN
jgi:hypothetical protein